jgi:DnaJ-class molecular chaperone
VRLQGVNGKPMTCDPGRRERRPEDPAQGPGEASIDGGPAGDLTLTVTVRKHPVFEREGNNLRVDVPVTFAEATLGGTIEVPTLGGEPGQAQGRTRHSQRARAARQGPRGDRRVGHPVTCSRRCRSSCPTA